MNSQYDQLLQQAKEMTGPNGVYQWVKINPVGGSEGGISYRLELGPLKQNQPLGGGGGGGVPTGPNWKDISGYFDKAIKGLTTDVEGMYQQGKRRTMSDIAMQSVNAGMANTLNMPAAGIAYDEANRPATNLGLAQAKAGLTADLGKVAAGVYGENLGAQTSRYGVDVGAQTSLSTADMSAGASNYAASLDFQSSAANRALQKYLGELEMKYKSGSSGGGSLNYLGVP